jgi:hypothetical protein
MREDERIDLTYVRRVVSEFADALDEPERVEAFERLLAGVLASNRRPPRR